MRIVLDKFPLHQDGSGFQLMIKDLFAEMARLQPLHSCVMLAGKELPAVSGLPSNVTVYPVNTSFKQLFGKKAWYRYFSSHDRTKA